MPSLPGSAFLLKKHLQNWRSSCRLLLTGLPRRERSSRLNIHCCCTVTAACMKQEEQAWLGWHACSFPTNTGSGICCSFGRLVAADLRAKRDGNAVPAIDLRDGVGELYQFFFAELQSYLRIGIF